MGFAVLAILFSAIIGAGATAVCLWSWIRTPPLGTFDDECFNPTDDLNGYGYSITSYLHTGDVGRDRPPSDDEESIIGSQSGCLTSSRTSIGCSKNPRCSAMFVSVAQRTPSVVHPTGFSATSVSACIGAWTVLLGASRPERSMR